MISCQCAKSVFVGSQLSFYLMLFRVIKDLIREASTTKQAIDEAYEGIESANEVAQATRNAPPPVSNDDFFGGWGNDAPPPAPPP